MKIYLPYAPFRLRQYAIRTSNVIVGFLTLEIALENIENVSVVHENDRNQYRTSSPDPSNIQTNSEQAHQLRTTKGKCDRSHLPFVAFPCPYKESAAVEEVRY